MDREIYLRSRMPTVSSFNHLSAPLPNFVPQVIRLWRAPLYEALSSPIFKACSLPSLPLQGDHMPLWQEHHCPSRCLDPVAVQLPRETKLRSSHSNVHSAVWQAAPPVFSPVRGEVSCWALPPLQCDNHSPLQVWRIYPPYRVSRTLRQAERNRRGDREGDSVRQTLPRLACMRSPRMSPDLLPARFTGCS